MIEEDLPLLNDQEEYDLFKDILSDEVHDIYYVSVDTGQEKSESELTPSSNIVTAPTEVEKFISQQKSHFHQCILASKRTPRSRMNCRLHEEY